MYQSFLFFGGSKHGERISVREQDTCFLVRLPAKFLIKETGAGQIDVPEKEMYCKQKWRIDEKTEFVFVLSSLVEKQAENQQMS
jgi:hypothetical protein